MKTQYLPTISCSRNSSVWFASRAYTFDTLSSVWIPEAASAVDTKTVRSYGASKAPNKTTNRDNGVIRAERNQGFHALHFTRHLTRGFVLQGQCDSQEQLGRDLPALRSSTVPPEVRLAKGTAVAMSLTEEPEIRCIQSRETDHMNQTIKNGNDVDGSYRIKLSTGDIPCWAARLPFVHPLHQLIQRGCLGIQCVPSKLSKLEGLRGSISKLKSRTSDRALVPHSMSHSTEDDNKRDCKLKGSQSSSSSSLTECQGSGSKVSCQESPSSSKTPYVMRREQQQFRNTKKVSSGMDPRTAVTVGRVTLEKRQPSVHRAVQQQYRYPTGRGMTSLKVRRQTYLDPVAGCSKQFARRLAELARAETETIHWEMTRKNKKKTVAG
ncbi:uncharacterized protein LOC134183444 isoform X2 [Corticium candelabrum]|uniref:uncharacterized protein LOC134183444 isoform X2 n=1 Tax=Corticium candelabrum TaxID=121492 RepID=UPI002E26A6A5|nr:uncharacterized protein LOC134183444 isoform X2 [Corticium candelabrum]